LQRGLELHRCGLLQEAEDEFEQALRLQHDYADAHVALARLQIEQQRWEDACDSLQLAVAFNPQCTQARSELAVVLAQQGDRDAAMTAVEKLTCTDALPVEVWSRCAKAYKILKEYDRAAHCWQAALRIDPQSADIACQLGYARFLEGNYDAARSAYEGALALDAEHVATMHNLGLLELETGSAKTALALFKRAFAARSSPETLSCIGHALRDLGELEQACDTYNAVLSTDPSFGDARINLSYALLMRGEYEAGWRQYHFRFEATGTSPRGFGFPEWQGEPLSGRRLLVYAEQGLGDEIMFASCIPDVLRAGADCVLECNSRLAPLFTRSFPAAYVHGGRKADATDWVSALPACDYQVAIGSLPRYFRNSVESFEGGGYLQADPHKANGRLRSIRAGGPVIGISWRGGTPRGRGWMRSIPLTEWTDLLKLPGCRFVALQHGQHASEIAQLRSEAGIELIDCSDACADIDELAAVVDELDLVITVDNTLAHLAGALGRPVWVLLPAVPEWRYPRSGERMPWYGSMRLFRKRTTGHSNELMQQLIESLQASGLAPEPA
jgi:tetratricopeptide (TPR) repeat protein